MLEKKCFFRASGMHKKNFLRVSGILEIFFCMCRVCLKKCIF